MQLEKEQMKSKGYRNTKPNIQVSYSFYKEKKEKNNFAGL